MLTEFLIFNNSLSRKILFEIIYTKIVRIDITRKLRKTLVKIDVEINAASRRRQKDIIHGKTNRMKHNSETKSIRGLCACGCGYMIPFYEKFIQNSKNKTVRKK